MVEDRRRLESEWPLAALSLILRTPGWVRVHLYGERHLQAFRSAGELRLHSVSTSKVQTPLDGHASADSSGQRLDSGFVNVN